MHQRLARTAPDQVNLKAAALSGKKVGRMGADLRRLEFARAEDGQRIVLCSRRAEQIFARDLLRGQ